jgi:ABC-type sugar transport system ATPase subunit
MEEAVRMDNDEYILRMKSIEKSFFGTRVLTDVDFDVRLGEVHALMGENGAGKSTLMKIIMGIYTHEGGEIFFEGSRAAIRGTREALKLGISMIHQELNSIPEMTVEENIFVGREKKIKGTPFLDRTQLRRDTLKLLKEYNMDKKVSPSMKMAALNIAQRQLIEIIKAVSSNSKLIIMDEPTSSLSSAEVDELFRTIQYLKERNVGIVYISHRIDEVMKLADRISVLRDGVMAGCFEREQVDYDKIIKLMVGRELSGGYPKNTAKKGDVVLEIKNFTRKGVFENISLEVRAGEIVGLAGLVGAGRSEVVQALVGYDKCDSGEVYFGGKRITIKTPRDAKNNFISIAPEDRKALGLVLCRNIKENISLQNSERFSLIGFINRRKERDECTAIANEMAVKMNSIFDVVINLSGGNQQKVVLARCLMSKPRLVILDEPTRGIDIGAKASIYNMMIELAEQGKAIIMISSEMPELIGMSDRILVMSGGKLRGEYAGKDNNAQEKILKLALDGV